MTSYSEPVPARPTADASRVEITVDARQLPCPQPLLLMRRALREQPAGTLVEVLATDPGSWHDFHSFARLSGTRLLRAEEREDHYCYWLIAGH
ncbi:sulfurtransferase TusA family protein [Microbulbifer guangxiensis]|uniref:sulfurtransferase TusA family protein n=1 Tax=Microbulbifer guangxiensis TaxID=2904249 RepID=UPI001F2BB9DE|nr:sulfurtransferase TusA family protein [Microbulbifer guangxiensis]